MIVKCQQCSISFNAVPFNLKRGKGKYCSKKCYGLASRGKRVNPKGEFKKGVSSWNKGIKGVHHSPKTEFKKGLIPWNKGKKFVEMIGSKNPNWKGGISPINKQIRKSLPYKNWRIEVFERDNYTCLWCGYKGNKLQADHIKPFAFFPELRFELSNGRTLCVECHRKTETFAKRVWNYMSTERSKNYN